MAITIVELSNRLNNLVNDLQDYEDIMVRLGSDAILKVKSRVQDKGENADGQQFPAYSTKPMLVGKKSFKTEQAFNKIAGSKEKRKELKWVSLGGSDKGFASFLDVSAGGQGPSASGDVKRLFELSGGYKQFRELHTRQTKFVDFTFTGEMMNNIKIVSSNSEHSSGVVVIAAEKDIEKKKLAGNTKRKGDILELSRKEIAELQTSYDKWVDNLIRQNKLR